MKPSIATPRRSLRPRPFWLALLALAPLGCGSSGPAMAPVFGRITYQGKPLTKGTITFQAASPDRRNATGMIDEGGNYTLQTEEPGDGAEIGGYYVTISSRDETVLDYIPKTPVPPKLLVPAKYEMPDTSGLMRTVAKGGGRIDFDLAD